MSSIAKARAWMQCWGTQCTGRDKQILQEFKDFIAKGNAMDMAVGIIIGAAFTAIVKSVVGDLIKPFIGLFMGVSISPTCSSF